MKTKNVVIGALAGGAIGLALVTLSKKENRNKIAKSFSGLNDWLVYGLLRYQDLKDSVSSAAEKVADDVSKVVYKTHGKVNEEKSAI